MNKVFIRTRQIDNNKQLPILLRENDDLTDFNEYSNISKSSQILSGMDKGEESEHHLQEVLRELQYDKAVFNKAIPIPEVSEEPTYEFLYKTDFKLPKHYIRLKTLDFEDELPEYDLDEEDKEWLENSKLNVSSIKFEQIIEQFERACCQKALLLDEAKSLLRHEAIHLVIAIYDYWLTKRVNTGQTLILSVKSEKAERCNNTPIDPYIAFRKRSEKMTTRKNRRVDETSYEKMFRLRCQMEKLSEIIQLVSRREATKSQITQNERDLFVKRYEARDYDKLQLRESEITIKRQSLKLGENFKSAQRSREENQKETKRKRSYSKCFETNQSSAEHHQSPEDIDFTFRPMSKCKYLPSRFTIDENSNGIGLGNSASNTNSFNETVNSRHQSSSFALSNLLFLPEPLKKLNTPIRFRLNSNRMVSIDLQGGPSCSTNNAHDSGIDTVTRLSLQRLQPSVTATSHQRSHEPIDNRSCNRLSGAWIPSSESMRNPQIRRLWSLYTSYVHCGLSPMNYLPADSSANSRHISSRSHSVLASGASTSDADAGGSYCSPRMNQPPPPSLPPIAISMDIESENHRHNNGHHNGLKTLPDRRKINHFRSTGISEKQHSSISLTEFQTTKSTPFSSTSICSSLIVNDKQSSVSNQAYNLSQLSHSNGGGGEKGDTSVTFTYQNSPSSMTSLTSSSNLHHNQHQHPLSGDPNRAFLAGESRNRPVLNGQHRITTATASELVESRSSNHGFNGGFKSKVGLNCLKSLTNKRAMIPPKDPGDEMMMNLYSKSTTNGHHRNHHHNNNISVSTKNSNKNHNNNNHHLSLSHLNNSNHNTHSWLGQSTASDSCLIPNLVVPLWKSEQPSHVMTSVNKMT